MHMYAVSVECLQLLVSKTGPQEQRVHQPHQLKLWSSVLGRPLDWERVVVDKPSGGGCLSRTLRPSGSLDHGLDWGG